MEGRPTDEIRQMILEELARSDPTKAEDAINTYGHINPDDYPVVLNLALTVLMSCEELHLRKAISMLKDFIDRFLEYECQMAVAFGYLKLRAFDETIWRCNFVLTYFPNDKAAAVIKELAQLMKGGLLHVEFGDDSSGRWLSLLRVNEKSPSLLRPMPGPEDKVIITEEDSGLKKGRRKEKSKGKGASESKSLSSSLKHFFGRKGKKEKGNSYFLRPSQESPSSKSSASPSSPNTSPPPPTQSPTLTITPSNSFQESKTSSTSNPDRNDSGLKSSQSASLPGATRQAEPSPAAQSPDYTFVSESQAGPLLVGPKKAAPRARRPPEATKPSYTPTRSPNPVSITPSQAIDEKTEHIEEIISPHQTEHVSGLPSSSKGIGIVGPYDPAHISELTAAIKKRANKTNENDTLQSNGMTDRANNQDKTTVRPALSKPTAPFLSVRAFTIAHPSRSAILNRSTMDGEMRFTRIAEFRSRKTPTGSHSHSYSTSSQPTSFPIPLSSQSPSSLPASSVLSSLFPSPSPSPSPSSSPSLSPRSPRTQEQKFISRPKPPQGPPPASVLAAKKSQSPSPSPTISPRLNISQQIPEPAQAPLQVEQENSAIIDEILREENLPEPLSQSSSATLLESDNNKNQIHMESPSEDESETDSLSSMSSEGPSENVLSLDISESEIIQQALASLVPMEFEMNPVSNESNSEIAPLENPFQDMDSIVPGSGIQPDAQSTSTQSEEESHVEKELSHSDQNLDEIELLEVEEALAQLQETEE